MTTVIALRRVKQYKTLLKFMAVHTCLWFMLGLAIVGYALAKMFHFHNQLKYFIYLLISSLPLYTERTGNYLDFFPVVINTWAGNYEVATDKGNETTSVYSNCLGAKFFINL